MFDAALFAIIFSGIWTLVGSVFLAIGLGMRRHWQAREERLRGQADATVLEVIRHTHQSSGGSGTSWNPLVEFDYEGRKISLEADEGVSRKKYYEGQRVSVRYDPDNPAAFRIEGENAMRLLYRVFIGVGAGCLAIAAVSAVIILMANRLIDGRTKAILDMR